MVSYSKYLKLKEFIARVAGEFGVPPPGVIVMRNLSDECNCAGFYDIVGGTIYLDDATGVKLDTVLHELAHHMQAVLFKERFNSEETRKPHCERRFEVEAKVFASFYRWYYEDLWNRVVEGVG